MAYYRKPALGMDDIHHLLGVTLRDGREQRCGRIVGLDYNHDQPIIDVLWEGQKKVERVSISLEQLAGLMKAFVDARRVSNVRAVGPENAPTHSPTASASGSASVSGGASTDALPERRRA